MDAILPSRKSLAAQLLAGALGLCCCTGPSPPPTMVTLEVTKSQDANAGDGSVRSSPAGILCAPGGCLGSAQTAQFPIGTQVTLSATPDASSSFGGWTPASCSTGGIGQGCTVTLDSDKLVTALFMHKSCPSGSFCLDNLGLGGIVLRGIYGDRSTSIYVVGDQGTILYWNGSTWNRIQVATTAALYAVFVADSKDVWAVGDGGIILKSAGPPAMGALPSFAPDPKADPSVTVRLWGLWAASASDAWAVGEQGTLVHWNGTAWSKWPAALTQERLRGVFGRTPVSMTASNDVWAIGENRTILHYANLQWVPITDPLPDVDLYSITGSNADLWAVGADGTLLSYENNSQWTIAPSPGGISGSLYGVFRDLSASPRVWTVGAKGAIASFSQSWSSISMVPTSSTLYSVWAQDSANIWAVGDNGTIMHYDP